MPIPIVIAIAGPTCSGKTIIANSLAEKLTDTTIISLDSYYRDLTSIPPDKLEHWNFDQPSSIDYNLLIDQVKSLSQGESIIKPVYQFSSHTRSAEGVKVIPKKIYHPRWTVWALLGGSNRSLPSESICKSI